MRIHVILTGGTIGAALRADGTLAPASIGEKNEFAGDAITWSSPYAILSENLTPHRWNKLITHFRSLELADKDAILITHGTDTLAYTACLFALLLYGFPKPVFFVSSNLPYGDEGSNGPANFKAALAAAADGVSPGVYVPWRHPASLTGGEGLEYRREGEGNAFLYKAESLLQSADYSDTFQMITDPAINILDPLAKQVRDELTKRGRRKPVFPDEIVRKKPLIYTVPSLIANILAIRPYPGIRYDAFRLNNVTAILHGTYHSFTAADTSEEPCSLTAFAKQAKESGIPVYLAPLPSNPEQRYASLKRILDTGYLTPLCDMSFEMAYAMLTILFSRLTLDLM